MSFLPDILFIVGPTAVGKSAVALNLALRLKGEIVCCDAMQVYREISIASNKPSTSEQARVAHHLFDQVSIGESYDVAQYYHQASSVIEDIKGRQCLPIVTGGSGLYMQILIDGIFEEASTDEAIRLDLESRAQNQGVGILYEELVARDPESAARIHGNDGKRIIRALEAWYVSGQPLSVLQKKRKGLWDRYSIRVIVLDRERSALYSSIDQRVDAMFDQGLVEEIERLGVDSFSQTARYLIGVREVLAYLQGQCSLDEAKSQIKQNTRRYAKRQLTWYRKDPRWDWLLVNPDESVDCIAERILGYFEN